MASRKNKSSKRSDTNLRKRLEDTVFFVDRSIGDKVVPQILIENGLRIERHSTHFPQDSQDIDWLSKCGENGWIVLAKDKNIKKNLLERQVLLNSGVAAFILTGGRNTGKEMAMALIRSLKRIANLIQSQRKPFIARINLEGKVELWIDHKGNDHLARRHSQKKASKKID
jgi:predicted nuclease of predicted toxin-antitoxin system